MKLNLLFYYPVLNLGGAERSSMRMMSALLDRGHDVTLVLETGGGNLESSLDSRIRLIILRPAMRGVKFLSARTLSGRVAELPDLLSYIGLRLVGFMNVLKFWVQREKFDMAATLLHGTSTWFCRSAVRAKTRVHFIRNDLSRSDPSGDVARRIQSVTSSIDYYVCVSEVARQSLVTAVPEALDKAHVIYNILDPASMRLQADLEANQVPTRHANEILVLSVCRLHEASKALIRMARVCRRLSDEGFDFRWYVVGEGRDRKLLEAEIASLRIENQMCLLGEMSNPFPAYRRADVVAMLSSYEGLCGVVNEAKVLGKPVIATRVSGIDEQLTDGENGLIVENDEDAIMDGMRRIFSDQGLRDRLAEGGYPEALLNDDKKLAQLEGFFGGK